MPEMNTLITGRQESAGPVPRAIDGHLCVISQDDIGWQILVLGAQGETDPRAQAGPSRDDPAGVHHPEGLLMVVVFGVHRANHGDVVGTFCRKREYLRVFHAAGAGRPELERRTEQGAVSGQLDKVGERRRHSLAMAAVQLGLGVEQIDVARAAVLEELDHRSSPRPDLWRHHRAALFSRGTRLILAEHDCQCKTRETARRPAKPTPPAQLLDPRPEAN